jgi:retron-type reverse transcriptase
MPLEKPFVVVFKFPFHTNVCMLKLSLATIDISKAFDLVDHTLLIEQIERSILHHNYVCWLAAYIRGRTACVVFNSTKSPPRIVRSGTVQGSVTSPDIFNYFVSDCPEKSEVYSLICRRYQSARFGSGSGRVE